MKIYIAASFPMRRIAFELRAALREIGHKVDSRWIDIAIGYDTQETPTQLHDRLNCNSHVDLQDVADCDEMIVITEGRSVEQTTSGGRHVETGFAMALGKSVVIYGPRENVHHHNEKLIADIFHHEDVLGLLRYYSDDEVKSANFDFTNCTLKFIM